MAAAVFHNLTTYGKQTSFHYSLDPATLWDHVGSHFRLSLDTSVVVPIGHINVQQN